MQQVQKVGCVLTRDAVQTSIEELLSRDRNGCNENCKAKKAVTETLQ